MVKGISFLRQAASAEGRQKLSNFLNAMGFAPGKGWAEAGSTGTAFLAPLANLTLVEGALPGVADLMVEVTSLDAAHQTATVWLKANGDAEAKSLSAISETSWHSNQFTVEPVKGFALTFWAWSDPLKGKPLAVEGDLSAEGLKFSIVVARWNAVITDRLLEGSLDALLRSGAKREDIEIVRVPGAWEIANAARTIANRTANQGKVDAIITLGCLIRGETAHYEAIYTEVARGIGQSQQETGIPHGFGVLTCETLEQALNRAGIKAGNKGFEAAAAAIEMVSVNRKIKNKQQEGRAL